MTAYVYLLNADGARHGMRQSCATVGEARDVAAKATCQEGFDIRAEIVDVDGNLIAVFKNGEDVSAN